MGGGYVFKAGRLFYGPDEIISGRNGYGVRAPVFDIDMDALTAAAKASSVVSELQTPFGNVSNVAYMVYVTQTGEIVGIDRRGLDVPEIEAALHKMRVLTPGRLGDDAVPTAVLISIPIK